MRPVEQWGQIAAISRYCLIVIISHWPVLHAALPY